VASDHLLRHGAGQPAVAKLVPHPAAAKKRYVFAWTLTAPGIRLLPEEPQKLSPASVWPVAVEADPANSSTRLGAMRGLRTDRTAQVIIAGHAFMQNLRRGQYELGLDVPPALRIAAAFTELAPAI
jgi:hypothetical protein